MLAIVARDETAFAALYERHADLVYATSYRVLGDAQLAEDAAQEVFVRLWRRPETFVAERGRFLSWVLSVSRNRAVDELRARARRRRREIATTTPWSDDDSLPAIAGPDDPAAAAQSHEERVAIRQALTGLPAEQQRTIEMAYFGGLTQQEIAAALGQPLGTVKTRVRLGMQKLRRALDRQL